MTEYHDLFQGIGCMIGKYDIKLKEMRRLVSTLQESANRNQAKTQKNGRQGINQTKNYMPCLWTHWLGISSFVVATSSLDPKDFNFSMRLQHFQKPKI